MTQGLNTYDVFKEYILDLLIQEPLEEQKSVKLPSKPVKNRSPLLKERFLSPDEEFLYDSIQEGGSLYALLLNQSIDEPAPGLFLAEGEGVGVDALSTSETDGNEDTEHKVKEGDVQMLALEPYIPVDTDDGGQGWLVAEGS